MIEYSQTETQGTFSKSFEIATDIDISFGQVADINDQYIVVGSIGNIFVYSYTSDSYILEATLEKPYSNFGQKLKLNNTNLLIPVNYQDGELYHSKILVYDITTQTFLKDIVYPVEGYDSRFGESIAINEDTIIINSPESNRVFVYNNVYEYIGELPKHQLAGTNFSDSVAVAGNTIMVSSPDVENSAVYTYRQNNIEFTLKPEFLNNAVYGTYISGIDDNIVAICSQSEQGVNVIDVTERMYSLYFNGRNDYAYLSEPYRLEGDFTVEAWVYINDIASNPCLLAGGTDDQYHQILQVYNGKLYFSNSDVIGLVSKSKLLSKKWIHVAVTRKDEIVSLFVNGVLENKIRCMKITPTIIKYLGCLEPNRLLFKGFMTNIHVQSGYCKYTENFDAMFAAQYPTENTVLMVGKSRHFENEVSGISIKSDTNLISEVSLMNKVWNLRNRFNLGNEQAVVDTSDRLIVVAYPFSNKNGTESGSMVVFHKTSDWEFLGELAISPEMSHGGKYVKAYKNRILYCAPDINRVYLITV